LVNLQVLENPTPGTPGYEEETRKIINIINGAVGYDPANPTGVIRPPQVEFLSFAPLGPPLTPPTARPWWQNPLWILAILAALIALTVLALLFKPRHVAREERAPLGPSIEEAALPTGDEERAAALEERRRAAEIEALERERRRRRRQELIDLADADPEAVEKVLRMWLDAAQENSSARPSSSPAIGTPSEGSASSG